MKRITIKTAKAWVLLVILSALGLSSCGVPFTTSTYSTLPPVPVVTSGSGAGGGGTQPTTAATGDGGTGGGGFGAESKTVVEQKGFVVQLLASSLQESADQVKNQFVQDGYPAFTNTIVRNGQTLYRVQIGPYSKKQDADLVLSDLKQRYQGNAIVKQAFVNENR